MTLHATISAQNGSENIQKIKEELSEDPDAECVKTFDCTSAEFQAIEPLLERKDCKGIVFNSAKGKLQFLRRPTLMHAACSTWLINWVHKMEEQVADLIDLVTGGQLEGFGGDYAGSKKTPDSMMFLQGRIWPTIALEAGYSESHNDLVEDANLLINGSEGRIGLVILVKLEPLRAGETSIQLGFVETHIYNAQSQTRSRYGERLRLYPAPANRAQQEISLTWRHVLRGQTDEIEPSSEHPPFLRLDDLRRLIDRSVSRYLALRSTQLVGNETNSSS